MKLALIGYTLLSWLLISKRLYFSTVTTKSSKCEKPDNFSCCETGFLNSYPICSAILQVVLASRVPNCFLYRWCRTCSSSEVQIFHLLFLTCALLAVSPAGLQRLQRRASCIQVRSVSGFEFLATIHDLNCIGSPSIAFSVSIHFV